MNFANLKQNRSGAIMLESLIVIITTVFLLFFTLALFSVMYQRYSIKTIVDEAAAKMAQNYEYSGVAKFETGVMSDDQYTSVSPYRYTSGNYAELVSGAEMYAAAYLNKRLERSTYNWFSKHTYTFEVSEVALGRRYVTVTAEGGYTVPFGDSLKYFGFKGGPTFKVTGYAECLDLSHYINTVDYVNKWAKFVDSNIVFKTINNVLSLFGDLKKRIGGP